MTWTSIARVAGSLLLPLALAAACGSSSGGLIAFVSTGDGDPEIFLVDPDTGEESRLTDNGRRDLSPRWSPDRRGIIYLSDETGNVEVNLVDRKGEAVARLTHSPGVDGSPVWAPDGKRFAFISEQDGNPEVYVANADGSVLTRVTSNSTVDQLGDWSPDGEWLVFYSLGDGPEPGLWLRNPDGVNLVHLTQGQDSDPAWSPTGQHIALVRADGDNRDIYLTSKPEDGTWQDETKLTRLTQHPAPDLSPVWSPDGKKILFVSLRDGNAELYLMQADGSRQRRLTNNVSDDLQPAWSPDGKRIAFVSYLHGTGELFVMGADGSGQRRLTNNSSDDTDPDW